MPTNGFSIKPLKVKRLAGEQKATEPDRRNLIKKMEGIDKTMGYKMVGC